MDELELEQLREQPVADLWEMYQNLVDRAESWEREVEELQTYIAENRTEARQILHIIEDIQGEIDWG